MIRLLFPLLFGLGLSPAALAKCDPDALAEGARSLAQAAPTSRAGLAALSLARACTFPAPLQQSLQEVNATPRDRIAALDRRTVAAVQDLWAGACPGGLAVLSSALTKPPAEGHALVFQGCAADRLGFASAEEFGAATGSLALPILVGWQLAVENINPAHSRDLVRALAGVDGAR